MSRAITMVAGLALLLAGIGELSAEQIVLDTSAEFSGGTWSDVEDAGSGSSPAVRLAYELPFGFGNGSDGTTPVSGVVNTYGAYAGINVASRHYRTSDAFAVGDRVIIHQSQGTGAGTWEFNEITSKFDISGGMASYSLLNAFAMSYGSGSQMIRVPEYSGGSITGTISASAWDGSKGGIVAILCDGTLNISGTINAAGMGYRRGPAGCGSTYSSHCGGVAGESYNQAYNSGSGHGGGGDPPYSPTVPGGGGRCMDGNNGTGAGRGITGAGAGGGYTYGNQNDEGGGAGGGGGHAYGGGGGGGGGDSNNGGGSGGAANSANGGGGGGGGAVGGTRGGNGGASGAAGQSVNGGAGGAAGTSTYTGGGGSASNNTRDGGGAGGAGGGNYGQANLQTIFFGSGGAAGGGHERLNHSGGAGGHGGGIIIIIARQLNITGTISVNGNNGSNSSGSAAGGGGGGAAGSILLRGDTVSMGTLIRATGGSGGGSGGNGGNGGAGSIGRIRSEYGTGGISGSSSPASSNGALTFKTAGTYISPALATTGCAYWETMTWSVSGGTVAVQTRSSSDAANWSEWADVTESGATIASPADDYLQYQVSFAGSGSATPALSSVTINYATNNRPTDPASPVPAHGGAVNTATPLLGWAVSTDADGESVTYDITIDDDSDLSSPLVDNFSTGAANQYQAGTLSDGVWYWRVRAFDGTDYNFNSATWSFTVDTVAPVAPAFTNLRCDFVTGRVSQFRGTGEDASTLSFFDAADQPVAGSTTWDGNGKFTFTPTIGLPSGSTIYVRSDDTAGNSAWSERRTNSFDTIKNVFKDTSVRYGSTGSSMRLEGATSYEFRIVANGGAPITVSGWLRRNSAYGSTNLPTVTLSGLGISGTGPAVASMTAGANTWQQVTVTGTPTTAGVLTLKVESLSDLSGAAAWFDELSVQQ